MLRNVLVALLVAHGIAIYAFVRGFLLTRIHLSKTEYKGFGGDLCSSPYKKLVWIVVDALRYDFVVDDGRYHYPGRHVHMPFLSKFVQQRKSKRSLSHSRVSPGAKVFRYIADAPTTTTQRLKSMTTGSLPVFFDVTNAFSASSVDEDNLIDQFLASGKRMVFMGDSTWDGLYPTQFNESHSFPCYNIMDLDSVDDGIDGLLLPTIQNHEANPWDVIIAHYLGVDHAGHAHGVESDSMRNKLHRIDSSIKNAVEALHTEGLSDVLVLVTGDHGQTLTGDHGGGSPEEVDSVLVAIDVDRLYDVQTNDTEDTCTLDCSCGNEGNQCVPDLTQIDLVPTLAGFFDVPIPFVNLGKVSKSLWSMMERRRCTSSFMNIVKANAEQVFKYLDTYSKKSGSRFPSSIMEGLRRDFVLLQKQSNATEDEYLEFLGTMEQSARDVWTQFHEGWMLAGCMVFLLVVAFQCSLLYFNIASLTNSSIKQSIIVWILVMVHPIGIFSFFFLLGEGLYLSYLVFGVALSLFLLQTVGGSDLLSSSKGLIVVTSSCFLISKLGLQSHSGFAFWQRLTVHDDSSDVVHQHFGEDLSNQVSGWLQQSTELSIDPTYVAFGIHYMIPGLLILYLEDLCIKKSMKNGGLGHGYRLVHSVGFASLLMYHLSQHGGGWSHMTLNHVLRNENNILIGFLDQPLDILLPRVCFASVVAVLSLAIAGKLTGRITYAVSLTLLRAALSLLILLVSPMFTPLILLGLYFEIYGIWLLLTNESGTGIQWLSLTACMTVIQSQAFFISGHLCEFSGLLYTAAFVGQKDYDLIRSGMLLGLDTCGCMILVILTSLSLAEDLPREKTTQRRSEEKYSSIKDLPKKIVRDICLDEPTLGSFVMFGFTRSLVCFSAMISAGIQRRHLYAWALFAPKFIFEIFFVSITYVVLILVSFLL